MVFTPGDSLRTFGHSISLSTMGPSPTAVISASNELSEGKGRGRGMAQGRGWNRGRGGNKQARGGAAGTNLSFKGHTTELGGHIFQVFHESNN